MTLTTYSRPGTRKVSPMSGRARSRTVLALAGAILLGGCGQQPAGVGVEAQLVPITAEDVAAVTVSPRGLETFSADDPSFVYYFGADGRVTHVSEGHAVHAAQTTVTDSGTVSGFGRSIVGSTESGTVDEVIDPESITSAAVAGTASSTFWFDSGMVNGAYSSRFAVVDLVDRTHMTGSIEGIAHAAAYCNERSYVLAHSASMAPNADPDKLFLYEITETGAEKVLDIGGGVDTNSVTPNLVCTADNQEILAFRVADAAVASSEIANDDVSMLKINPSTGALREIDLNLGDRSWRIRRSSMYATDGRLYWVSGDNEVLSTHVNGSGEVKSLWSLPDEQTALATANPNTGNLSVLSLGDTPSYRTFAIEDGREILGPVSLPWLSDVIDSPTPSGKSLFVVSDIDAVT